MLSEVTSPTFEVTLDAASIAVGEHELMAEAALEDGTALTDTLRFEISAAEEPAQAEEAAEEEAVEEEASAAGLLPGLPGWVLPVGIGGGALILVVIIVAAVLLRRRPSPAGLGQAGLSDMTTDIRMGPTLATLTVEESLSLRPGQRFDLTQEVVRLGRGIDNDIIVPDAPVSRNHARIHYSEGAFRVFDEDSTYGTFVNDVSVGPDGHPIDHGDTLMLGTRTQMTFTTPQGVGAGAEDRTMDISQEDDDDEFKTVPFDE
jgi:hypothetical protein